MEPLLIMQEGCHVLDDVLVPRGFRKEPFMVGKGSGGSFATAQYIRGKRRLSLSYRYSLGEVFYHLEDSSISHEAYIHAVLGRGGANHYPGFSDNPLDGFLHLRYDLEHFCFEFLAGTDDALRLVMKRAIEQPKKTGLKALSGD